MAVALGAIGKPRGFEPHSCQHFLYFWRFLDSVEIIFEFKVITIENNNNFCFICIFILFLERNLNF